MSNTIGAGTRMIQALVVLVCVHLVSAGKQPIQTLTHAELINRLNRQKLGSDSVAQLLSMTKDQKQKNVIMRRYSVDELLKLDSPFKKSHCSREELMRRRDIYLALAGWRGYDELENDNLLDYCSDRIDSLKNWCKRNKSGFQYGYV